MNEQINLAAVLIADIMGFILTLLMFVGNTGRLKSKDEETRSLKWIIFLILAACVTDALCSLFDGHVGTGIRITLHLLYFLLYLLNIAIGPLWMKLIICHLNGSVPSRICLGVNIFCAVATLLLVVNLFVPLLFRLDDNNVYSRGPLFVILVIAELLEIVVVIVFYIQTRIRGGIFKFFPVWQFTIPVAVGIAIQMVFYGVSLLWPCLAIALCGILTALKNELVYQDKLTGLYNRYYLDALKKDLTYNRNGNITAVMLDMNNFKHINDDYGHSKGDEALIIMAGIMRNAVGTLGNVIRYAGDEFVILLNTQDESEIQRCIKKIRNLTDKKNRSGEIEYELSAAIGYCRFDMKKQTVDELLNEIDQRMYEDKTQYYQKHDRRKSHSEDAK